MHMVDDGKKKLFDYLYKGKYVAHESINVQYVGTRFWLSMLNYSEL
jgi:hypothetical protein